MLAVVVLAAVGSCYFWDRKTGKTDKSQPTASSTTRKPAAKESQTDQTAVESTGTAYENPRFGYAVEEPAEWTVIKSANGDGMTASSPDNTATIKVYGFRSATFNLTKTADEMAAIEMQVHPGAAETGRKEIVVDGHPALEVAWTFTAGQNDEPMEGELRKRAVYSLKDEAAYALEYIAEAESYDKNVGYFDSLVATFKLQ